MYSLWYYYYYYYENHPRSLTICPKLFFSLWELGWDSRSHDFFNISECMFFFIHAAAVVIYLIYQNPYIKKLCVFLSWKVPKSKRERYNKYMRNPNSRKKRIKNHVYISSSSKSRNASACMHLFPSHWNAIYATVCTHMILTCGTILKRNHTIYTVCVRTCIVYTIQRIIWFSGIFFVSLGYIFSLVVMYAAVKFLNTCPYAEVW